jgi:hypothetical protein
MKLSFVDVGEVGSDFLFSGGKLVNSRSFKLELSTIVNNMVVM